MSPDLRAKQIEKDIGVDVGLTDLEKVLMKRIVALKEDKFVVRHTEVEGLLDEIDRLRAELRQRKREADFSDAGGPELPRNLSQER